MLLLRDGKVSQLDVGGMVTGVLSNATYDKGVVDLKAGDCVLLYSDGVTDAMNEYNERFGRERLDYALQEIGSMPAQEAVDTLLDRLDCHRGECDPNDDITIVLVKVG